MAKVTSVAGDVEFKIEVKENLDELIEWFTYLEHGRFTKRYGELVRTNDNIIQKLTEEARRIVRVYVYEAYEPITPGYQRSYNLFNSMRAVEFAGGQGLANINIVSDTNLNWYKTKWSPTGRASLKPYPGQSGDLIWSYAAFFLKYKTFINSNAMPRRNFWTPLMKSVTKILKDHQRVAAIIAINEKKPKE